MGLPSMTAAQDYPRYRAAGSTDAPLDSWVYPARERLVALRYAPTAFDGMKPWTLTECARLTDEVGEALRQAVREARRPDERTVHSHAALEREFAHELEALGGGRDRTFRLESVYTRVMSISGPPFTDGYHFGSAGRACFVVGQEEQDRDGSGSIAAGCLGRGLPGAKPLVDWRAGAGMNAQAFTAGVAIWPI